MRVFLDALERLGYPVEAMLARAGIDRPQLAVPDARISCAASVQILASAMEHRPLKNLGVRIAAETPLGAFPLLDYLVVCSETVALSFGQLARYLQLVEAPYTLAAQTDENSISARFENVPSAFTAEFGITLSILRLRQAAEEHLALLSVHFCHALDDSLEMEQILRAPVYGNSSWNGFRLSREAWQLPLRSRNPALGAVLEEHARQIMTKMADVNPVERDVRRVLTAQFMVGNVQIGAVARALAISARSLQRRLAACGLSFQEVVDRTRRDAAAEYLSNPRLSVGEIAYLLGYAEPAAFHRAFKRWHCMTPQAFRANYSRSSTTVAPAPPSDRAAG